MRWLSLVIVLVACHHDPGPGPVAPCAESPRVYSYEELDAYLRRRADCVDEACHAALRADAAGVLVSVRDVKRLFAGGATRGSDAPIEELRVLKQHACACTNADCANAVQQDFEAWAMKYADTKGSQAQAEAAHKLAEEISECMVKAMTTGTP